jgi:hypothetical protein
MERVLESWVIVLLNEMYLKSLMKAMNTRIAITFLFEMALKKITIPRSPFLTSPLGTNFDPRGAVVLQGLIWSPGGEVIPWG